MEKRFTNRMDQVIEKVFSDQPGLLARTVDAARAEALRSLGLVELQRRLDELVATEKHLNEQKEITRREMFARVKGSGAQQSKAYSEWFAGEEVNAAIQNRQVIHEEEILARDPLGRRIIELRREKEALRNAVWLATSGKQIEELWEGVSRLLNEEMAQLQSHVLRIDPVENGST